MMLTDRWRYDETRHCGVDFSRVEQAEAYDREMQPLRDVAREVGEARTLLELQQDHRLAEIGTGTGEMAIGLAPFCREVIALDVSPAMLQCAARKTGEREVRGVEFRLGGFLTCDLAAGSLDAVVSQFALHHLPDFWKHIALKAIHAALKPGGRFLLKDIVLPGGVNDYESYFTEVVGKIAALAGDKLARDTEISLRDEHPTLDWIMQGLLRNAGFTIVQQHDAAPFFIKTYLCRKAVPGPQPAQAASQA